MNIIARIWNKAIDTLYMATFPNVEKSCRISHKTSIGCKSNLIMGEFSSIGNGATIMNTRAKVVIGKHFVSGPGLTIITGDHMPVVGQFLNTVSDADKDLLDVNHEYDKDVVIEDDVWTGYGVTIMKGVTIGRGSIVAARAMVNKNVPPYCVVGGVPAKVLKFRWTIDQILEHESKLYPENERYTRKQLEEIFTKYSK